MGACTSSETVPKKVTEKYINNMVEVDGKMIKWLKDNSYPSVGEWYNFWQFKIGDVEYIKTGTNNLKGFRDVKNNFYVFDISHAALEQFRTKPVVDNSRTYI